MLRFLPLIFILLWSSAFISGKIIVQDASPFAEGLAAVKVKNRWGFIDKTGEIVIKLKYDRVFSFTQDLACINVDGKWGFIDKTGRTIIQPQFDNAFPFSENLAPITVGDWQTGKWGFIDKAG